MFRSDDFYILLGILNVVELVAVLTTKSVDHKCKETNFNDEFLLGSGSIHIKVHVILIRTIVLHHVKVNRSEISLENIERNDLDYELNHHIFHISFHQTLQSYETLY